MGSTSEAVGSLLSDGNTRVLVMVSANFPPLAGILNVGYYTHSVAIPIVRQNACPERKFTDLAWGYFAVMLTYVLAGVFGYCGFIGYSYRDFYAADASIGKPARAEMFQNFTLMFGYDSITAIAL